MTNTERPEGDLADEFHALGENFKRLLHAAWESEEKKKVQTELEAGLVGLGASIDELVSDLQESATAQRLREDVEEFTERMRTGEVEEKMRHEILQAIQTMNDELAKITKRWSEGKPPDEGGSS